MQPEIVADDESEYGLRFLCILKQNRRHDHPLHACVRRRYKMVAMAVVEAQDLEARSAGEREMPRDEYDWSQLGVVHREDPWISSSSSVDLTH